jgi:3-deoxy-D-manno-octulosonic acid (KDO) 8-phosphate synthase
MSVEPAPNPVVAVGAARFGNGLPLALIAGPCALESRDHALEMASGLKELSAKVGIDFDAARSMLETTCATVDCFWPMAT